MFGVILILYNLLSTLVWLLPWLLMAGWIVGMADPAGRWAITRFLAALGAPFLRLVAGMIPPIGALDVSPFLIILLSWLVGRLLRLDFFGF